MGNSNTTTPTALTLEHIEIWTRPLNSAISNLFGALHSFVVIRLSDSSTRLIEKHHDGTVDVRLMNQRDILDLALNKAKYKTSGYKKIRSASIVGLTLRTTITDGMKRNITLKDLLVVVGKHEGSYEIHESNCHRLTADVWNFSVIKDKAMPVLQQKLSKFASVLGVARTIRLHTI